MDFQHYSYLSPKIWWRCYAFSKPMFYTKPHGYITKITVVFKRPKQSICISRKSPGDMNFYALVSLRGACSALPHAWARLIFLPWKSYTYFISCWITICWRPRSNVSFQSFLPSLSSISLQHFIDIYFGAFILFGLSCMCFWGSNLPIVV